jgi:hypothetical protein
VAPSIDAATLALAQGDPLLAVEMVKQGSLAKCQAFQQDLAAIAAHTIDPVSVAEKWHALNLETTQSWLQSYLVDYIKNLYTIGHKVSGRLPFSRLKKCFELFDMTLELKRNIYNKINVNTQLALEAMLCQWHEVTNHDK